MSDPALAAESDYFIKNNKFNEKIKTVIKNYKKRNKLLWAIASWLINPLSHNKL